MVDLATQTMDEIINPHPPVYILRTEHPQVHLSWGSSMSKLKPDKLKLRRRVDAWPLRFVLKADYDTHTKEFSYGCSATDQLFGGRFSLNMPEQRIQYKKRFSMPNGAFLCIIGSCGIPSNDPMRSLEPDIGVLLEFGSDSSSMNEYDTSPSAVWVGNSFDIKKRLTLYKGIGVEVCGNAALPQPTAHFSPNNEASLHFCQGAFRVHIAELNVVVTI